MDSSTFTNTGPGKFPAQHDSVLVVQSPAGQVAIQGHLLSLFCKVHFAFTEKEAMDTLRDVADIRLIIADSESLASDNYRLLKYLKLNSVFQDLPVVNIAPVEKGSERFAAFCFCISDLSFREFCEEQFSLFIREILMNNSKNSNYYQGARTAYATGQVLSPRDIQWMEKLEGLVNLHLSDASYDTEKLAFDLHLSRSTLSRKIQNLYGINPSSYITRIRMEKALGYLQKKQFTSIAQVASSVGFRHAGSFSRSFYNHFGVPPSNIV
ncbi:MAG: helix-turn-helix domain-containing protein [Saprospiraceae bacterium]|nr:helix-turn-helix domain-containing protein [Saprospiraceae bacterium]